MGLPAGPLIDAHRAVIELLDQAAEIYVGMFRDTVWREHVDAGLPPGR